MSKDGKTIIQALPWLTRMFNYTDEVCACITEENAELKPIDPQGGYFFSVKEQLMHIADSRWECLDWLAGGDEHERYLAERFIQGYGETDKPWQFRDTSIDQAKDRLKEVRHRLESWLNQPAAVMLESNASLESVYRNFLEQQRSAGEDTTELEAEGPSCIADVLVFLAGHEQGHRHAIQMILRQHCHKVYRVT